MSLLPKLKRSSEPGYIALVEALGAMNVSDVLIWTELNPSYVRDIIHSMRITMPGIVMRVVSYRGTSYIIRVA